MPLYDIKCSHKECFAYIKSSSKNGLCWKCQQWAYQIEKMHFYYNISTIPLKYKKCYGCKKHGNMMQEVLFNRNNF